MRNHKTIWTLFLLLATASCGARAQVLKAPDPCDKATSQADMNDCYGKQYLAIDARLNRIYHSAMGYLQHDLDAGKSDAAQEKYLRAAVEDLKAAEVAWIKYRNLHCEAASQQYEGGTMASMIHSMCLSMTTEHRIAEIKQAYENGDRKLE